MSFKAAVHEVVQQGLRQLTPSVQGYVPAGGIQADRHTATIRIPNPHAGIHPGKGEDSKYLEFHDVPLPYMDAGQLQATAALVDGEDRGVLVNFRGANLHHPYIVSLIAPLHGVKERAEKDVKDRQAVTAERAQTPGAAQVSAPPAPVNGPPLPSEAAPVDGNAAARTQAAQAAQPQERAAPFQRVFGPEVPTA